MLRIRLAALAIVTVSGTTLFAPTRHADAAPTGAPPVDTLDAPADEQVDRGRVVYENICSVCHTLQPPATKAPPFSHVARHVRETFPDKADFTEHVLTFLPAPDAVLSVMPPMAVERFGLMPPQPLPEAMLADVAAYLWTLSEEGGRMGGGRVGGPADGG